ncbi:MAG: arginine--tRNA ligase [Candidatus Hydrogenedentes bacterium CG07_land_8_20_14_0_80_42_17]|nr:MAG: arginine--tRNA ligase [Candidatus Hydrogenedentes bacterium CG1_02_42_14]PIU48104.1 MAG: arginine--tRNA ligase [Candidatus Hydrogenedentes bacterium CG07_land_8_20_14_0_80_42_17]
MKTRRNICAEISDSLSECIRSIYPHIEEFNSPPVSQISDSTFGDYMSNIAFLLSKILKQKPIDIANKIAKEFKGNADAEPANPGFINFKIKRERLCENLEETRVSSWSSSNIGAGTKVNIEFVSANPTGDLHIGHGRGAVIGDTLARLFANAGFSVTREYYVNDIGKQIDALGESLLSAIHKKNGIESPYSATYKVEELVDEYLNLNKEPSSERNREDICRAADFAKERLLSKIMKLLKRLDISFDSVVRESSFIGAIPDLINELKKKDLIYEADEPEIEKEKKRRADSKSAIHRDSMEGGTFLRTGKFGDETDRIILRRSGAATYFTTDIIYHRDKLFRGYERLVNVWGADHAGHVIRLKAAMKALSLPAEKLEVVLCQMVRLIRGGTEVKMSKRAGTVVLLEELIDEVGGDPVRFFFLSRSASAQFDFDLDLAVKKSSDNPVFYCQYAHARTCQLLANGRENGIEPSNKNLHLLKDETELEIMRKLIAIPDSVQTAAIKLEPHRLVEISTSLSESLHRYQTAGKENSDLRVVTSDKKELSSARLYLVESVGYALRKLFGLMGINAPEKM